MTESEKIFHQIVDAIPNGTAGKMFGAKCIKLPNGRTAAFFWKEHMVFKLDEQAQKQALKLEGVKVGSHLYAPEKQMNGWISIPESHSDKWMQFAKKAFRHVDELKK